MLGEPVAIPKLLRAKKIAADRVAAKCKSLTSLVESDLSGEQLTFWNERWVREVIAMSDRLERSRWLFYPVRSVVVASGVVVPALVGLNLSGTGGHVIQIVTLVLSITSGLCLGLLETLSIRQRFRLNRAFFDPLYREGLLFATRSGKYAGFSSRPLSMPTFVVAVENWIEKYEAGYNEEILMPGDESASTQVGSPESSGSGPK